MSLYSSSNKAKFVKGDNKPAQFYKGSTKISGWKFENVQGSIANFINTYNDKLTGMIYGKTLQQANYLSKTGLTTQPFNIPLLSVPNGVIDTYVEATKTYTKNVNQYTLQASDIAGMYTGWDSIDTLSIKKHVDFIGYNVTNSVVGVCTLGNYTYKTSVTNSVADVGYFSYNSSPLYYILGIAKGTYSNLSAAQTALTGTVLTYQLKYPNATVKTLISTDMTLYYTSAVNVDYIQIPLTKFYNIKPQIIGIDGNLTVGGFNPEVDLGVTWDVSTSIGKWGTSTTNLYLFVAKGTYADLTTAQTALSGTVIVYQANSYILPYPQYPLSLIQNLAAGTYKITLADSIYEVALVSPLKGIGTYLDRICFDIISKKGWVDRYIGEKVFDGTETLIYNGGGDGYVTNCYTATDYSVKVSVSSQCTHFLYDNTGVANTFRTVLVDTFGRIQFFISNSILVNPSTNTTATKNYLSAQYNSGAPVTVNYTLAIPTRTMLTFTKVASSTAPELPASVYTATLSPTTPYFLYDAGGNLTSTDSTNASTVVVPTSRAIKVAADATEYTYIDEDGNKWVADTLEYAGNDVWSKIQRVGQKILLSTSSLQAYASGCTSTFTTAYCDFGANTKLGSYLSICSHFINTYGGWDNPTVEHYSDHTSFAYKYFMVRNETIGALSTDAITTRLTKFKAWLDAQNTAGTPVTVDYILATPITSQVALGDLITFPKYTSVTQDGYSVISYLDITAKTFDI